MDQIKIGKFIAKSRKSRNLTKNSLPKRFPLVIKQFPSGNVEFSIVKDTTSNMTNLRLYITSNNKT